MDTPTVTKTAVRNLQCNQDYTRVAYCKMLMQLTANHRMFTKVNLLKKNKANLSSAEFMLQYNKWDKEMIDFMLACKKKCQNIKTYHLVWSPIIGTCLCRLNIYR